MNGGIRKLDFALVEHAGCVNVLKPILKITLLFFYHTVFRDSSSKLTCEAIFVGCGNKNFNISRCMNNNNVFVIDGNLSGINVEYLHYSVYHNIGGENIDLIPLIYKAIMYNCALNYNENISYGFVYDNNTFLLLINGKINNGEYFINKEYYFKNVTCYNNVFAWNNIFNDILRGTFGLNLSNTAKTHNIIGTFGLKLPNVVTGKKHMPHHNP